MNLFPMTLIRSGGLPLEAWTPLVNGMPDWEALNVAEQDATAQLLRAFDEVLGFIQEPVLRTKIYNARKDFYQRRKAPAASLVALFQLEPGLTGLLETLQLWQSMQEAKVRAEQQFEQGLLENYRILQGLPAAWDEMMRKSLVFASHDLLSGLQGFEKKTGVAFDKRDRRSALALVQYLSRAVFKTSPLGRFTQVQAKAIRGIQTSEKTEGAWLEAKSMVTPNVALLPAIYEVLLKTPAFYQSLKVGLNPALKIGPNRAEWLYFDGEEEAFQQFELDAVLSFILDLMLENGRIMPFSSLLEALEAGVEASLEDLDKLLFQLLAMGLLEWDLPEKGLSPSWCGSLYNYLGYLPSDPVLTEAAYLLQWLRTSGRVLPFQSVTDAQIHQKEALLEVKKFLEKHGGAMPPIPAEQLFFEDFARDEVFDLPEGDLELLVEDLRECWQQQETHLASPFRVRVCRFVESRMKVGESMDFLAFARQFLLFRQSETEAGAARPRLVRHKGKMGALLQVYREAGKTKAVVNALYAGGGKMFARWLPLFPSGVTEALRAWQSVNDPGVLEVPFPWQGWSNANFQPNFSGLSLAVPDGRVGHAKAGEAILMKDLWVLRGADGAAQLYDKQRNKVLQFVDLGLEAPE